NEFAKLIGLLEDRRNVLIRLDGKLADFGVSSIASVTGERMHAARLRDLLSRAVKLVQRIADGEDLQDVRSDLDLVLNAGDWRLGIELADDLAKKAEEQERTIIDLEASLRAYEISVRETGRELNGALRVGH